MTILAPGCSKEQQTRRWDVHLFHLARVYRAKAVEACDLVPTMIQQLCHFSFESTSFDSCQPSSSVLSECSTCLYRKALLPFSHTAVGAYLRYRSGIQPCSRSQSLFPCLENTRAGSLMQGKKVHPHAAVLAVLADSSLLLALPPPLCCVVVDV